MGLNALSLAQPLPSMPTDHTRSKASSQRTSPSVRSRPTARDEPAGCWSAPGGPLNPSRQSPVT
jgi:hypothetical protein